MRNVFIAVIAVFAFAFTNSLKAFASSGSPDKFVGTWKIEIPDAPMPEYASAILEFTKENNQLKGTIGMNEYMKMNMEDLSVKGKKVQFVIYIQGEKINIELKRKGTRLQGTASYSQGILTINGAKQ